MANFRITVTVNSGPAKRGTRQVKRELNELERQARNLNRVLVATFAGISTVAAVRSIVRLLDAFNQIENRLRVVTTSQSNLNAVFDELFAISQRSRSSLQGTVDLYSRLAISSRELGVSQRELLQFTESVNKAIIVSGASFREANQGLIQLSQGIASGTLRGDELRSVLEQLPVVADVIAKELGVTRGELRKLGEEGKITANDIITAFQNAEAEIEENFAKTVPTLSQSLQVLGDNFIRLTGQLDNALGITEFLSRAILFLNENLEAVFLVLQVIIPALAVRFVAGLLSAASGAGLLTRAVAALNVVLGLNPFVRILTVITALIAAFAGFGDQINVFGSDIITLSDTFRATFNVINQLTAGFQATIQSVVNNVGAIWTALTGQLVDQWNFSFSDIASFLGLWVRSTINILAAFFRGIIAIFQALPTFFSSLFNSIGNIIISILEAALNRVASLINTIFAGVNAAARAVGAEFRLPELNKASLGRLETDFRGAGEIVAAGFADAASIVTDDFTGQLLDQVRTEADRIAQERVAAGGGVESEGVSSTAPPAVSTGGAGGSGRSGGRGGPSFAQIVANLEQENELLRVQGRERAVLSAILDAEKQLKRELTEAEAGLIEQLVRENQVLEEQSAILQELNGPQEQVALTLEALNGLLDQGTISLDQYAEKLRDLRVAATETNNTLVGGLVNGLARVGAEANNLGKGISEIVVGAFNAASDAVVEFAKTGEFNIREFFGNIAAQLLKLATNQLFSQLINGLFGGFGGGGFNILGSFGSALPGFATGGQFEVGGDGRTDSTLVAFRATRGERVSVETPQQQRRRDNAAGVANTNGGPANVAVAAVLSERDIENALDGEAGDRIVIRALERNPNAARRLLG